MLGHEGQATNPPRRCESPDGERRDMLSSLNAFGGLSAANLLTLLGANSSSSSATFARAQSAPTGVSASGASNAAKAIKAILAQAQIEQSQTATLGGGSASSTTVEAAYSVSMAGSGSPIGASATIWSPGAVQSIASEQWGIDVATQAAYAAVSAISPNDPANGIATIAAQERIGIGATDPWGGGLAVSVLGEAASAAAPGGSSSSASASATFLAPAAYQQIVSGGGSAINLAAAAYAALTGGSASLGAANVTLSLPDTAQQIAYAVTLIDAKTVYAENSGPVAVTAADAVNVTVNDGALSLTGAPGAALPNGLPSLADIQQATSQLAMSDPQSYPARTGFDPTAYEGSLTLVKLPPDALFAAGDNFIAFATSGQWNLNTDDKWALVLPQDTVTATVSDTQVKS
jgi:hypothetical protein